MYQLEAEEKALIAMCAAVVVGKLAFLTYVKVRTRKHVNDLTELLRMEAEQRPLKRDRQNKPIIDTTGTENTD